LTTQLYIPTFLGVSAEVYLILFVLGIIFYFLLNRVLANRVADPVKRKGFTILGTLVLTPLTYFIFGLAFIYLVLFPKEKKFDFSKEKWDSSKELRFEMRNDLVDSKMLENKTKEEVVRILGQPDNGDTTDYWTYDLGVSEAGFGWQFNDLKLTFEDERANKVELQEFID
jgi:hypothetical protein